MKKLIVIVLLLFFFSVKSAYCGWDYFPKIGEKFGRGLYNVMYSWLEVPKSIEQGIIEDRPYKAISIDPLRGLCWMVGRIGVGSYEIISFPFPQKPILRPTYIVKDLRGYLIYDYDANDDGP